MSDIAIQTDGLGKRYRLGPRTRRPDTLRDAIAARVSAFRRSLRQRHEEIWALRDVSFKIPRGQVVGVIGRNGAGKSTLLKILSRITEPSEGRALIHGRVASLLEVGVGFHAELSGRENIYVNGAILGMSRKEIARRFDEIVSFAEVERFIDTPVKHYSTGMQVRLAFAVAAHLEPEILLVDEVLAVGDAGFQKKCLGKMKAVSHSGRTILFVSHNLGAINALCDRAVLIDSGRLLGDGTPAEIISQHLASFEDFSGDALEQRSDRHGDGRLRVTRVRLADATGQAVTSLRSGDGGQIILQYHCPTNERLRHVLVNVYLVGPSGERICDFRTDCAGSNFDAIPGTGEFVCSIPRVTLQPGSYSFTVRVYSSERLALDIVEHAGQIQVQHGDFFGSGRLPEPGTMFMEHGWECRDLVPEAVF